ncbi:hypothetical protein EPN95_00350 [Patescibacteria group bacterium]|nr:MAG: hypothetical protein EPN95_00350 [Patescibacteria group bacterium]
MKVSKLKILIYILILVGFGYWFSSYEKGLLRTVTLETKGPSYKIYLSTNKNTVISTVTNKVTLKLHDGYYCGSTSDSNYDTATICFMVYKKDLTVVFNPNYSTKHLADLLVPEQDIIMNIIKTKYSNILSGFTVCNGELYATGDIYGTAVVQKTASPRDNATIYRVVLEKTNNTWTVIKNPELVLDATTYSGIPVDVLKSIDIQPTC